MEFAAWTIYDISCCNVLKNQNVQRYIRKNLFLVVKELFFLKKVVKELKSEENFNIVICKSKILNLFLNSLFIIGRLYINFT